MTQKQWERAYLEGVSARQTGKRQDANPYRDETLAENWHNGWESADVARRKV